MNNLNSKILSYFCVKFQCYDTHRYILGQALKAVYKLVHFLLSHYNNSQDLVLHSDSNTI